MMTLDILRERQAWTLAQKIDHSLGVIDQFNAHFDGKVYVAFSGGKDSCVMLDLVEIIHPNVPCMFIMTGCESPSVCRFIRQQRENHKIEIVRPSITLREVFAKCGFPLVSKRIAHMIDAVRRNPYCQSSRDMLWLGNPHHIPERWMYLMNEPYNTSDRCCFWLKKRPSYQYQKRTGRRPFIGLMASESDQRRTAYIRRGGCNSFGESGKQHPSSLPLAIWTEQDVWQYIHDRHLPIPDIYSKGATRTGCMGCGFGAHLNTTGLETMQRLWPKWYDLIMSYENNGVTYGEAMERMMSTKTPI
jgi:3'-phosphoadenosine 5'-phosphosulfate sulfotransferase (PAPS reductase)/FAD synthetase